MLSSPEFWVAVGFLILVAGIARPAWRGITAALDARGERIKASLDEARTLHEDAQHLLAEYQRKQRDAAQEAERIIAQAREEAQRLRAEATEALERTLERRQALAHEKIAQAEADALREVRNAAVDIAIAATAKVIGERLGEDRAAALIDESVEDLPRHLN